MMETKPMAGNWTLTAPDGRQWQAESPMRCVSVEQRDRVPADVALARVLAAASEPDFADRHAQLGARFGAKDVDELVDAMAVELDLLAWILSHPETAAEELNDAAAGDGSARTNILERMGLRGNPAPNGMPDPNTTNQCQMCGIESEQAATLNRMRGY